MTTKRKRGLASIALGALIVAASVMSGITIYTFSAHQAQTMISRNTTALNTTSLLDNYVDQFNVGLRLTVVNSDGSASSHYYPNDLILANLYNLFGYIFSNYGFQHGNCINLVDVAGGSVNPCYGGSIGPFFCYSCSRLFAGGFIGVGTGTTSPAKSDYKLQSQVGSWSPVSTPLISGNSVIVSAAITLTTAATVSEAGFMVCLLAANGCGSSTGTQSASDFMFFHDTFTGIPVASDQTIQVQYTLNLPSNSNNNLVAFFASMMQNTQSSSGGGTLGTITNAAGTIVSGAMYNYENGCQSNDIFCTNAYVNGIIQVGTSNAAVQPTNYALVAQVGASYQIAAWVQDSTNYYDMYSNSVLLSSAETIQEIGFFFVGYGATTYSPSTSQMFLMFRAVVSPISVSANTAISTQITFGF